MDELDWSRQNSDVLVWEIPGEEETAVLPKKKSVIRPAAGAAIVLSALITGTIFGVTMIRAVNVTEEKIAPATVSEAPVQQETQKVQVSVSVIQGGLFSTEAAAEKAAGSKAFPNAVIPIEGQYSVIFGAFSSKAEADQTAQALEESGTAVYVKSVSASMTDSEEKTFTGEKDPQKRLNQLQKMMTP